MFSKKKVKRQPIKVIVTLESDNKPTKIHNIDIPYGGSFKIGNSWDNPTMCNSLSEVVKVFDWEAGYTVIYNFQYE